MKSIFAVSIFIILSAINSSAMNLPPAVGVRVEDQEVIRSIITKRAMSIISRLVHRIENPGLKSAFRDNYEDNLETLVRLLNNEDFLNYEFAEVDYTDSRAYHQLEATINLELDKSCKKTHGDKYEFTSLVSSDYTPFITGTLDRMFRSTRVLSAMQVIGNLRADSYYALCGRML